MTDDTKTPKTGMFRKGGYMKQNPIQQGEVATLLFDYEHIDKLPDVPAPSKAAQESLERLKQTVHRFSSKGASVMAHNLPRIALSASTMTMAGRVAVEAAARREVEVWTSRITGVDKSTTHDRSVTTIHKLRGPGWEVDAIIDNSRERMDKLTAKEIADYINSDGINPHTRAARKAQMFGMMYGNETMRAMVVGRRRDAEIAQANIAAARVANALRDMFRPKFRLRPLHLEVLRAMEEVAKAGH